MAGTTASSTGPSPQPPPSERRCEPQAVAGLIERRRGQPISAGPFGSGSRASHYLGVPPALPFHGLGWPVSVAAVSSAATAGTAPATARPPAPTRPAPTATRTGRLRVGDPAGDSPPSESTPFQLGDGVLSLFRRAHPDEPESPGLPGETIRDHGRGQDVTALGEELPKPFAGRGVRKTAYIEFGCHGNPLGLSSAVLHAPRTRKACFIAGEVRPNDGQFQVYTGRDGTQLDDTDTRRSASRSAPKPSRSALPQRRSPGGAGCGLWCVSKLYNWGSGPLRPGSKLTTINDSAVWLRICSRLASATPRHARDRRAAMNLLTRAIGTVALSGLATAAPAAATLVTSSTFDGNVAATVAAFPAAGASAPSGSLVVVFSNASLPLGRVVVNDGAQDFNNAGVGAGNATLFNAFAGPAAVWIHTGADNTIQSNETISLNGTVIGGPIDENIGGFASLFQLFGTAVNGLNTVTINSSQGDVFDWDIAVLQTSPGPSAAPQPGTLLLLGPGLVALGRLAWRRHRS